MKNAFLARGYARPNRTHALSVCLSVTLRWKCQKSKHYVTRSCGYHAIRDVPRLVCWFWFTVFILCSPCVRGLLSQNSQFYICRLVLVSVKIDWVRLNVPPNTLKVRDGACQELALWVTLAASYVQLKVKLDVISNTTLNHVISLLRYQSCSEALFSTEEIHYQCFWYVGEMLVL